MAKYSNKISRLLAINNFNEVNINIIIKIDVLCRYSNDYQFKNDILSLEELYRNYKGFIVSLPVYTFNQSYDTCFCFIDNKTEEEILKLIKLKTFI